MKNRKGNANIYILFGIFIIIGISAAVGLYFFVSKEQDYTVIPEQNSNQNGQIPQNNTPVKNTGEKAEKNMENIVAVIKTNFGDIKIKLFDKDAPNTVKNFVKLSEEKFYDSTKFHRVIKDFMIQGGDPNTKDSDWSNDGMGGPGYTFADEINSHKLVRGVLAMANSGPNTNGSQFFIITKDSTPWLDGKHTPFGEVVEGMDTVDKIENVATTGDSKNNHPLEDVIVKTIEIEK